VPIDSYFWQKISWPELSVFYFNAILNKSSEWGVSPWNWYWAAGLPSTMLLAYPLSIAICAVDKPTRHLCWPFLAFVGAMSFLPHKELRFVFHAIPVFNVATARLLSRATGSSLKIVRCIGRMAIACILISTIAVTISKVFISRGNYSGAVALLDAQRIINTPAVIHIDVPIAMSGISRFLQYRQDWVYMKF
jgi:alpha-1,6-mannosyltransferase